jgi:hypothetical protein
MAHPYLAFCPYLSVQKMIEFADWQLGPLESFEDRWADGKFKTQAKAFLAKFVDNAGKPIEHPSLFCRRGGKIDGQRPKGEEIEALEAAIAFAFLDENPRRTPETARHAWNVLTADNAEPFFWPIDVEAGYVTVTTGLMVRRTRRRADLERATFGLDTVTGLVSDVTQQNLIVEVDYAKLSDADGPQGNVVSADPRGTSGGPVYRITDSAQGPGLEIIGFIYEQSELNRFVLARHADLIRPDGTIAV